MEVYRTEEEQVEALKQWWDEHGRTVIVGVVLGLAVVFAGRTWMDHKRSQADAASTQYQLLLDKLNAGEGREVTEMGRAIIGEHPNSLYAVFASLDMAQQAMDEKDLDGAGAHLRWALEHTKQPDLKQVISVRIARLLVAQGKYDDALQQLSGESEAFRGPYAEVRGDAYLALGKRAEAHKAYSEAADAYADVPGKQRLMRMKLDDLADVESAKQ